MKAVDEVEEGGGGGVGGVDHGLPDKELNSLSISLSDLDLGMFPIKSLVLGWLTLTFRALPSAIS